MCLFCQLDTLKWDSDLGDGGAGFDRIEHCQLFMGAVLMVH